MKKIFWNESYISVVANKLGAKEHKHDMVQIFIKKNKPLNLIVEGKVVRGNYIVIASGISHELEFKGDIDCFILIESTSEAIDQLDKQYIKGKGYGVLPEVLAREAFLLFYNNPTEENHEKFINAFFYELNITIKQKKDYDERVLEFIQIVKGYKYIDDSIEEMARRVFLSKSRLSHLVKAQTGVPLKSYMLLFMMRKAYLLIFSRKTMTEAAVEAGFYSASHLADTNRKLMGMTISEALEDSQFIEV